MNKNEQQRIAAMLNQNAEKMNREWRRKDWHMFSCPWADNERHSNFFTVVSTAFFCLIRFIQLL